MIKQSGRVRKRTRATTHKPYTLPFGEWWLRTRIGGIRMIMIVTEAIEAVTPQSSA